MSQVFIKEHRKFHFGILTHLGERAIFVCSSDSEKSAKKSKSGQTNVQEPTVSLNFSKICLLKGGIQLLISQTCFEKIICRLAQECIQEESIHMYLSSFASPFKMGELKVQCLQTFFLNGGSIFSLLSQTKFWQEKIGLQ